MICVFCCHLPFIASSAFAGNIAVVIQKALTEVSEGKGLRQSWNVMTQKQGEVQQLQLAPKSNDSISAAAKPLSAEARAEKEQAPCSYSNKHSKLLLLK